MRASWQTEADAAGMAVSACRLIGIAARDAIRRHGRFRLVLSGGGTPQETYRRLALSDQQWSCWSLFYGDERCLPADDPGRNSRMVEMTGLAERAGQHHPIPAELGGDAAAVAYREQIAHALPFDMVLLGMGDDGHTASLFPGHDWPRETVFAVDHAPKPPATRVTLGPQALQNCRSMLVLVSGVSKNPALQAWRDGADLPIAHVADVEHALVLVERSCLPFADDQSTGGDEAIESAQ